MKFAARGKHSPPKPRKNFSGIFYWYVSVDHSDFYAMQTNNDSNPIYGVRDTLRSVPPCFLNLLAGQGSGDSALPSRGGRVAFWLSVP